MLKDIVKNLEPSSTLKINEISRTLESEGKKIFKEVKVFKPKSSRKESKESFIICKILR